MLSIAIWHSRAAFWLLGRNFVQSKQHRVKVLLFGFLLMLLFSTCNAYSPQSSAESPATSLTSVQLAKLKAFVKIHGTPQILYAVVAVRLGLKECTLPKVALKSPDGTVVHAFFVLPDGGLIFGYKDTKTAYNYHVDSNLNLIASVAMTNSIASEIPDPKAELQKQFAYWTHITDELDDAGNAKTIP